MNERQVQIAKFALTMMIRRMKGGEIARELKKKENFIDPPTEEEVEEVLESFDECLSVVVSCPTCGCSEVECDRCADRFNLKVCPIKF